MSRIARPPLVLLWAPLHAGFAVCLTWLAIPAFSLGNRAAPAWSNLVPLAAAGLVVTAFVRDPRSAASRWLLRCAAVLASVSAFGLLMDLVTLAFNQRVDRGWPAVNHALGLLGLCALAPWLRAGPDHPRPQRVGRPVLVIAWIGGVSLLPYAGMKATWALGGTFAGVSGAEMLATAERNGASDVWLTLERYGVDATVLLAGLGLLLLVALLRPGRRRLPRWLLLGPAIAGASTLVPYGVLGLGYTAAGALGWVEFPRGDFPTVADALLVSSIGLTAFGAFGVALGVAAHSHWRRTAGSRG
jgi:D-alanyl-D-alanine dipeptidase